MAAIWCPLAVLLLCWGAPARAGWQDNLSPRRYVRFDADDTASFQSNHSDGDFFRILLREESFIIVGAREAVYNLSLTDLSLVRKLSWASNASTVELCRLKGKPPVQCQNYIRILAKTEDGGLLVCGTNAFSPKCRHYRIAEGDYERPSRLEKRGVGLCPHSPVHNSTSTYVDGQLYVGTAADFSGQDALILRDRLRTDKWETVDLDDPHFVNSFALGEHVYFFLREKAVEHINCGKRVYSRVARVCRQDSGGPNRFKHAWTSYVKTRLNCSVGGDFPFYFDEIQAVSDVVQSSYGGDQNRFVYGVFSTAPNAIGGSAVCAFRLQSVLDAFAGPFKERASLNSNWLPVPASRVPEPRPGQCVNDSKALPDVTLNFVQAHPLMDEAVGAFFGGPILTRTSTRYRFSAVAVDPRVRTLGGGAAGHHVDVIFVGTDNGRVIKAFNSDQRRASPVVIEEIQAFPTTDPVRGIHVSRAGQPRLVASSDTQVISIPLDRCHADKITICSECVALQDPYCAWDQRRMRCAAVGPESHTRSDLVQSVLDGVSPRCPQRPALTRDQLAPDQRPDDEFGHEQPLSFQSEAGLGRHDRPRSGYPGHGAAGDREPTDGAVVSAETLGLVVAATAISALALGFAAGHCCARRCRKDDVNLPYADTDYTYFDQRQAGGTRLNHDPALMGEEVTYSEPVLIPTNNMVSTLKKHQQDASIIPLQYTEGRDGPPLSLPMRHQLSDERGGPPLSLRGEPYGTHRQLRSRTLPTADPGLGEELAHRLNSPGHQDTPINEAYGTARSTRRVYL
ncbi:semaphorin-1A-like [Pollicipes pollicipes]|uniref:semaphorin-1A-like n=1 Tax=Pollicipes pollicipes TaxID=41117 RepID=UPI0018855F37|nr:semaphorin-1A-like [Pollicipes pollicipes]